jgi:hypothetical protein
VSRSGVRPRARVGLARALALKSFNGELRRPIRGGTDVLRIRPESTAVGSGLSETAAQIGSATTISLPVSPCPMARIALHSLAAKWRPRSDRGE